MKGQVAEITEIAVSVNVYVTSFPLNYPTDNIENAMDFFSVQKSKCNPNCVNELENCLAVLRCAKASEATLKKISPAFVNGDAYLVFKFSFDMVELLWKFRDAISMLNRKNH